MDELKNMDEQAILDMTDQVVFDAQYDLTQHRSYSLPIAELSTLGAGASSLIPELRTITSTTTMNMDGLYRLSNAAAGDILKKTKDGDFWGALKTSEGKSKMLRIKNADGVTATTKMTAAFNPATMMMAVALFSIEKQLGNIEEIGKEILAFLEIEKEAEIEADVETLTSLMKNYKYNWDNEHFIASNHEMVLHIQRTARKNMIAYQKQVNAILEKKKIGLVNAKVNTEMRGLQKKFRYYRLSLYTFSMASFLEIMLSGNFKEEYIVQVKQEIERLAINYRNIYSECSIRLEKLAHSTIETNMKKGLGSVGSVTGKALGHIPVLNKGPVDEFLQEHGDKMKEKAAISDKELVEAFAKISDPEIHIFMDKMEDLIQIYNHTGDICFDNERIYLVAS